MELIQRVMPFLVEAAQRHQQGNVVVVCHKTVCRLLACHILGAPLTEYRRRITTDNAAINVFEAVEGGWRVVTLNDTCHLPPPTVPSVAAEESERLGILSAQRPHFRPCGSKFHGQPPPRFAAGRRPDSQLPGSFMALAQVSKGAVPRSMI